MLMSCPPPNVGPYEEKKYMEYALRELYCPVWDSLTGAHPGLLISENKKALELSRIDTGQITMLVWRKKEKIYIE